MIINNHFSAMKGFMRKGDSVCGTAVNSPIKDRIGSGLVIQNDNLKMFEASKDEESIQKKKSTANFETAITERLANDRDHQKSQEEAEELVESVLGVIDQIKSDFGQEMATDAMAKILTDTEQRINANK
ncbi:MAG: hypothetical protein LBP22_09935 [Deltaproteobacteria bacterium]|jgi:hypothetical protein|nr:hypothetical protein [Deltaproteobacteria bacterium]